MPTTCPHCQSSVPVALPHTIPVESGHAYKQVCPSCRRTLSIRPHLDTDPPAGLEEEEIAGLKFSKWRTGESANNQIRNVSDKEYGPSFKFKDGNDLEWREFIAWINEGKGAEFALWLTDRARDVPNNGEEVKT